jgi:hypothetical protein
VASGGDDLELTADRPTTWNVPIKPLAIVSVLALVIGAVGLVLPRVIDSRDTFAADRGQVVTRAEDFAVAANTLSSNDKADYQRRVKPLMTKSSYADFTKTTDAFFAAFKQLKKHGSTSGVKVQAAAVSTIDKDSATAIISFTSLVRASDAEDPDLQKSRYQIFLRKVGGTWLVNDFDPVPVMRATLNGTGTPSKGGNSK